MQAVGIVANDSGSRLSASAKRLLKAVAAEIGLGPLLVGEIHRRKVQT